MASAEYLRKYRKDNPEFTARQRELSKIRQALKIKNSPWIRTYDNVRQRCLNPKTSCYKYYGGKGVKLLMTVNDFKTLWFRDKAYLMEIPSIDRIDSEGHYEISNCQYIEHRINSRKRKY